MGIVNKWVESLDYEFKVLHPCTRHQSPHSSCTKCLDVCAHEAITIVDEKPYIFNEKCKECGYCKKGTIRHLFNLRRTSISCYQTSEFLG